MSITLTEASKLVGITKNGLLKAIQKGKLSAIRDNNKVWKVEPAELFRAYPPVSTVLEEKTDTVSTGHTSDINSLERVIDVQHKQINDLREQLSQAHADKAKILKMMDEQISTMRVLTDQRQGREQKKGFWGKLFG